MKRSGRELSIDMVNDRDILKNNLAVPASYIYPTKNIDNVK